MLGKPLVMACLWEQGWHGEGLAGLGICTRAGRTSWWPLGHSPVMGLHR